MPAHYHPDVAAITWYCPICSARIDAFAGEVYCGDCTDSEYSVEEIFAEEIVIATAPNGATIRLAI
jgi:hypothetical protein